MLNSRYTSGKTIFNLSNSELPISDIKSSWYLKESSHKDRDTTPKVYIDVFISCCNICVDKSIPSIFPVIPFL